jgi:hypothetical protein
MDTLTPEIVQIQLTNGDIMVTEVAGAPSALFLKRHLALQVDKTCVIRVVREGKNVRREVHPMHRDPALGNELLLNTDHLVCAQKVAVDGDLMRIYRQNVSGLVLEPPRVKVVRQ